MGNRKFLPTVGENDNKPYITHKNKYKRLKCGDCGRVFDNKNHTRKGFCPNCRKHVW